MSHVWKSELKELKDAYEAAHRNGQPALACATLDAACDFGEWLKCVPDLPPPCQSRSGTLIEQYTRLISQWKANEYLIVNRLLPFLKHDGDGASIISSIRNLFSELASCIRDTQLLRSKKDSDESEAADEAQEPHASASETYSVTQIDTNIAYCEAQLQMSHIYDQIWLSFQSIKLRVYCCRDKTRIDEVGSAHVAIKDAQLVFVNSHAAFCQLMLTQLRTQQSLIRRLATYAAEHSRKEVTRKSTISKNTSAKKKATSAKNQNILRQGRQTMCILIDNVLDILSYMSLDVIDANGDAEAEVSASDSRTCDDRMLPGNVSRGGISLDKRAVFGSVHARGYASDVLFAWIRSASVDANLRDRHALILVPNSTSLSLWLHDIRILARNQYQVIERASLHTIVLTITRRLSPTASRDAVRMVDTCDASLLRFTVCIHESVHTLDETSMDMYLEMPKDALASCDHTTHVSSAIYEECIRVASTRQDLEELDASAHAGVEECVQRGIALPPRGLILIDSVSHLVKTERATSLLASYCAMAWIQTINASPNIKLCAFDGAIIDETSRPMHMISALNMWCDCEEFEIARGVLLPPTLGDLKRAQLATICYEAEDAYVERILKGSFSILDRAYGTILCNDRKRTVYRTCIAQSSSSFLVIDNLKLNVATSYDAHRLHPESVEVVFRKITSQPAVVSTTAITACNWKELHNDVFMIPLLERSLVEFIDHNGNHAAQNIQLGNANNLLNNLIYGQYESVLTKLTLIERYDVQTQPEKRRAVFGSGMSDELMRRQVVEFASANLYQVWGTTQLLQSFVSLMDANADLHGIDQDQQIAKLITHLAEEISSTTDESIGNKINNRRLIYLGRETVVSPMRDARDTLATKYSIIMDDQWCIACLVKLWNYDRGEGMYKLLISCDSLVANLELCNVSAVYDISSGSSDVDQQWAERMRQICRGQTDHRLSLVSLLDVSTLELSTNLEQRVIVCNIPTVRTKIIVYNWCGVEIPDAHTRNTAAQMTSRISALPGMIFTMVAQYNDYLVKRITHGRTNSSRTAVMSSSESLLLLLLRMKNLKTTNFRKSNSDFEFLEQILENFNRSAESLLKEPVETDQRIHVTDIRILTSKCGIESIVSQLGMKRSLLLIDIAMGDDPKCRRRRDMIDIPARLSSRCTQNVEIFFLSYWYSLVLPARESLLQELQDFLLLEKQKAELVFRKADLDTLCKKINTHAVCDSGISFAESTNTITSARGATDTHVSAVLIADNLEIEDIPCDDNLLCEQSVEDESEEESSDDESSDDDDSSQAHIGDEDANEINSDKRATGMSILGRKIGIPGSLFNARTSMSGPY